MVDRPSPQGGCKCGAVRYVLKAQPLTAYICHCHLCQKRTGSAFSMALVTPAGSVEVTSGRPSCTERLLESGKKHLTWTCPSCSTQTHTEREGGATMIIRAGTLDETARLRPVAQFWTTSAQAWALVPEDILSYGEQPTDYAPLMSAWKARGTRL